MLLQKKNSRKTRQLKKSKYILYSKYPTNRKTIKFIIFDVIMSLSCIVEDILRNKYQLRKKH